MRNVLPCVLMALLVGCQGVAPAAGPRPEPQQSGRPVAYLAGEAVTQAQINPLLMEAAGGPVLADLLLDRELSRRLEQRSLAVAREDLEAERQRLLQTLASDSDQAARLLEAVRRERGLGSARFESLLRRNAALRKLVEGQVQVEPVAVRREYEQAYGPRYQPRVIVAGTLQEAARLRQRVLAGEPFEQVAAEASADPSASVGGLLAPISPVDPSYPEAVRDQLAAMDVGQVSQVLAVDGGYAVLKLERKIPPRSVEWADVQDTLAARVRQRGESQAMQVLARSIITDASVTVLDPALQQSWRQHRQGLTQP